MKSYLAAAIQLTSVPDLHKNLAQAEELIELAVRQGAELVGLPENSTRPGTAFPEHGTQGRSHSAVTTVKTGVIEVVVCNCPTFQPCCMR